MRDVHIHFLHGHGGGYTQDFYEGFISNAERMGLDEIYLLEHTHQFIEFESVYSPVKSYNEYQHEWVTNKMDGSIERYLEFIDSVKGLKYPIGVKFGLEVCFIPETADKLSDILKEYSFDFLTGSVHWIDGWGFDHPNQKETWHSIDVNDAYDRYYEIMCELCCSGLFTGLAHPDSIKCFGHTPTSEMTEKYQKLAVLLNKYGLYAENSGGLQLNYDRGLELGLNSKLLNTFKQNGVTICSASDAHKQSDVGANILELDMMLRVQND